MQFKARYSDFHRKVFRFRSWFNLLGVVLAFLYNYPFLKIFKSLQNCWHSVTDIASIKNFWNVFRFRDFFHMLLTKSLTRSSTVIKSTNEGGGGGGVKSAANFVSSGSKIAKRYRHRKYDPEIIEGTIRRDSFEPPIGK